MNNPFLGGYERDTASGLDYANARMYNPGRGRFMQPDPSGLKWADLRSPQSLNYYSYVQNDPVNFSDPTGMNREYMDGAEREDEGRCGIGFMCAGIHSSAQPNGEGLTIGFWVVSTTGGGGSGGSSGGQKPPCPGVPQAPANANIDRNIAEAMNHRPTFNHENPQADGDYLGQWIGHALWFYDKVKTGGDWDYKTQADLFINYGNFHYGAVALAAGFSENTALRMAGWAHQRDNNPNYSTIQAISDLSSIVKDFLLKREGGTPLYGDDANDQAQIRPGFQYYDEKFVKKNCQ